MILLDIEIHGFRPYREKAFVEFSPPGAQNVTLIEGLNGAGKTSLFSAINWALYGKSAISTKFPIVNKENARQATESNPARAVVHLRFQHEGQTYKLTRSATAYWQSSILVEREANEQLWITRVNGNYEKESEPSVEINRILPAAIRTFFLFDAELLNEFIKPGPEANSAIASAVNDVLRIRPLTKGVEDLRALTAAAGRKMASAPAPEHQATANLLRLLEIEDSRKAEKEKQAQSESIALLERQAHIDEALSAFIEISKQAAERGRATAQLRVLEDQGKNLRSALATACISSSALVVSNRLEKAIKLLDSYKSEHRLPSRIQDFFIQELLHAHTCICGRQISEGSAEEAHLKDILGSLLPGSLQDRATTLLSQLKPLFREAKSATKPLESYLEEIQKNSYELDRVQTRIEQLGGEIDAAAAAEAKTLNAEHSRNGLRIKQLEGEITILARDRREIARKQRETEEKLRVALSRQEAFKELSAFSGVASGCLSALTEIKRELEEIIRKTLSDQATKILLLLANDGKPSVFFSRVEIGANFMLAVHDIADDDVRNQLSMGQNQISSLSFMLAMTRLGGQEAPLVIDTPTARIDQSVRGNMAKNMPSLSTQLIFLMTDSEYVGEFRERLAPRIGRKYMISATLDGAKIKQEFINA